MVVKRAHTASNVAPAIVKLRDQINAAYPRRDRASDGIWPSAAHTRANPSSDHEAGNALDIDNDLADGVDVMFVALLLSASRDSRIKYIIHDGRIWNRLHGWHPYTGSNPHSTHMHISVKEEERGDADEWVITAHKVVYRCLKTHGAHTLPTWLSPTRGKWTAGRSYRCTAHRGKWLKLRDATGRQLWGYSPHFK